MSKHSISGSGPTSTTSSAITGSWTRILRGVSSAYLCHSLPTPGGLVKVRNSRIQCSLKTEKPSMTCLTTVLYPKTFIPNVDSLCTLSRTVYLLVYLMVNSQWPRVGPLRECRPLVSSIPPSRLHFRPPLNSIL
jgi:hypothetical protein